MRAVLRGNKKVGTFPALFNHGKCIHGTPCPPKTLSRFYDDSSLPRILLLQLAREAFDELDSDHDGCLFHMEVVRLIKRFMPGKCGRRCGAKGGG